MSCGAGKASPFACIGLMQVVVMGMSKRQRACRGAIGPSAAANSSSNGQAAGFPVCLFLRGEEKYSLVKVGCGVLSQALFRLSSKVKIIRN
ncbi:hypothetical protein ACQR1I_28605 [Bradyrhizobium sp. HKCCYLS2038]|uniref:hypothetical protein n=1 Tax=unclassified Bradyrhizobium TaxID=2631580 RepID=UPI003EBC25EF